MYLHRSYFLHRISKVMQKSICEIGLKDCHSNKYD